MWHDPPIYEYERKSRPRNAVWRFLNEAVHPFVCIPYLPILILCVVTYTLLRSPLP